MGRLENKVALVTGASSGMGYEIAKLFAKEGASVVVIARRKEKLADLVAQIEADGGKAIAVAGDVTSEDDVQHAVKTAVQKFGKLDIVVNNAGMLDKMRPVTEVDDDLWNAVINVNLTGPNARIQSCYSGDGKDRQGCIRHRSISWWTQGRNRGISVHRVKTRGSGPGEKCCIHVC